MTLAKDARELVAGSYARQSVNDAEGIAAQHQANSEWAKKAGLSLPSGRDYRFSDNNISGGRTERPEFDRLKEVVAEGAPFQFLIVRHPDRFGRWSGNVRHFISETHWFEEHGVRVVFTDGPAAIQEGDVDDVGAIREFMKAWMAGQEIKLFKERTRQRSRKLAMEGYWVTGQCPYGTERWLVRSSPTDYVRSCERDVPSHTKGFHTVLRWASDGTKEIVMQIFDAILAGYSAAAVARLLNDRGVPAPHQKAWSKRYRNSVRSWRRSTIYAIVNNPVYCGAIVYGVGRDVRARAFRRRLMLGLESPSLEISGRGPVMVRQAIPDAPIDEDTWFAVQREVTGSSHADHPRKRASSVSILSGHVVCAYCNRKLWIQWNRRSNKTPIYLLHYHTGSLGLPRCAGAGSGLHIKDVDAIVEDAVADLLDRSHLLADAILTQVQALLRHRVTDAVASTYGPTLLALQVLEDKAQRLWLQLANLDPGSFAYEQGHRVISSMEEEANTLKAQLAHQDMLARQWQDAATRLEEFLKSPEALSSFFRGASVAEKRRILLAVTEPLIVDLKTGRIEIRFRLFNASSKALLRTG